MKRIKPVLWFSIAWLLAAGAVSEPALGEEREAPQEPKAPTTLRELIDAGVRQIEVFPDAQSEQPAEPLVAMRWANNARGSEDGLTVLYIHGGRPLAAACLYPWAGRIIHDFEAIGRAPVVARRAGALVWRPKRSAVAFAAVAQAPAPAETPTQRLRQMKSLAEGFQSSMLGWKADSTDREQLRLLPKPLYRYEVKDVAAREGEALDGAVFAFVMGTDPESLLLLEAVERDGARVWEFAFARRTSGELEGRHGDKVVWHAARFPKEGDSSEPHFGVGTPIPPDLLPVPGDN